MVAGVFVWDVFKVSVRPWRPACEQIAIGMLESARRRSIRLVSSLSRRFARRGNVGPGSIAGWNHLLRWWVVSGVECSNPVLDLVGFGDVEVGVQGEGLLPVVAGLGEVA